MAINVFGEMRVKILRYRVKYDYSQNFVGEVTC